MGSKLSRSNKHIPFKMSKPIFSVLLALLLATVCQAFAPVATKGRVASDLAFERGDMTFKENPYNRGGKASWEFESETMYVDDKTSARFERRKAASKQTNPQKQAPAAAAPRKANDFLAKLKGGWKN